MIWISLGWFGLAWVALDWFGLFGLFWVVLGWLVLGCFGLIGGWFGLVWFGLGWIGSDWFGLFGIGLCADTVANWRLERARSWSRDSEQQSRTVVSGADEAGPLYMYKRWRDLNIIQPSSRGWAGLEMITICGLQKNHRLWPFSVFTIRGMSIQEDDFGGQNTELARFARYTLIE